MKTTENKAMILNTSDEAAEFRTGLSGWVSKDGRYWGDDERMARWDGCTHVACSQCGKPVEKTWISCESCRNQNDWKRYSERPKMDWNGTDALFSEAYDRWFFEIEDIEDYCRDHGVESESMMLRIGIPVYAEPICSAEHYADQLPDDAEDVPSPLQEAFDTLNKWIIDHPTLLSWEIGPYATTIAVPPASKESAAVYPERGEK